MKKVITLIKNMLPFGFVTSPQFMWMHALIFSNKIYKKYKHNSCKKIKQSKKMLIYFADGSTLNGGLTDRLNGIVTVYYLSRELQRELKIDIDFKIHFTHPDDLNNYLQPNRYDWSIKDEFVIYNIKKSIIYSFFISNRNINFVIRDIKYLLKHHDQIHIITNDVLAEKEYCDIFNTLFKPSPSLEKEIQNILMKIGTDSYISVVFRFQQLLGDFKEHNYHILPDEEKKELIKRCIKHLIEIYNENIIDGFNKVLVCSDSNTFLKEAEKYDFVFVSPGNVIHLDYCDEKGKNKFMKSFIDYFLLSKAKKTYLVIDGLMYSSGFPYRASSHQNTFFIRSYFK